MRGAGAPMGAASAWLCDDTRCCIENFNVDHFLPNSSAPLAARVPQAGAGADLGQQDESPASLRPQMLREPPKGAVGVQPLVLVGHWV